MAHLPARPFATMAARTTPCRKATDVALYPRTILGLCSGVGMLEIAVSCATGAIPVCYCEREAFAAATLVARMADKAIPPSPIWDDLTTFDGQPWRGLVDCLTAGFPCQPWSVAGKGRGTEDDRWIWPDIVRIVAEVEPPVVFLENTPGLLQGGKGQEESGAEICIRDLAAMGYDCCWGVFSAQAVGASHLRKRVFILAVAHANGQLQESWWGPEGRDGTGSTGAELEHAAGGGCRELRESSGREGFIDGDGEGLAHAPSARCNRREGSKQHNGGPPSSSSRSERYGEELADAEQQGLSLSQSPDLPGARRRRQRGTVAQFRSPSVGASLFAPGPGSNVWAEVLELTPYLSPAIEPGICLLADGMAPAVDPTLFRADQLRACGNGVVPLTAAVAFTVLWRRLNGG